MNKYFKYAFLSFAGLLMFSTEISAKTAPSFDCNKASTEVEKILPPHRKDTSGESPKSLPVFSCTKEKCTKIPNKLSLLTVLSNSNEKNKSQKIVKMLELGGDINEEDATGWTPLYFVLFYALDDEYASTTKTLLSHGANINYINQVTDNTLVAALSSNCNEVSLKQLEVLHIHGFNLNTRIFSPKEYYGENPTLLMSLISSALHNKKCIEKVKYLLNQDVDVNTINYVHEYEDHKTVEDANALFYVLDFDNKTQKIDPKVVLEITQLFIHKGINKHFVNSHGHDALYFLNKNEVLKRSPQYMTLKELLME